MFGLILFEISNEVQDLDYRHEYIFRYYDSNCDKSLNYDEFRFLFEDFFNTINLYHFLKRIEKSKNVYVKEILEQTWTAVVNKNQKTIKLDQYVKAFDIINQEHCVRVCWMFMLPFFEQINSKFNSRTIPTTNLQKIVDKSIYNK